MGIKRIPDNSVDCILTDPPYLYLKNQKLDRPFDEQALFSEFKRVLKPTGFVVMFGRGTSFYRWNTILAELGFEFKEEIVWDKSYTSSPLMPLSRVHETIVIYTKNGGFINKVKVPYLGYKAIHPTQKPVRLLERLLALTTQPGDVVLDPFSGSCSTAVACINTERKFIGFEIDSEYYEAGIKRLKEVFSEPKLAM